MESAEADDLCNQAVAIIAGNGKDPAEAAAIFEKVADAGFPNGMFGLAELKMSGRGTAKDVGGAIELYEKAYAMGSIPSAFRLGNIYWTDSKYHDPAKCYKCFKDCCEAGLTEAYNCMGDVCFFGVGTPVDKKQAVNWYNIGAKSGNPSAMFKLGCLYESGDGVEADRGKSLMYFSKAASQNVPEALFKMATLAYDGETGGGKPAALSYYEKCADRIPVAKFNMATMLLNGDGVEKDQKRAFALYNELAEAGDGDAMFQVGRMLIEGVGTDKDPEQGFRDIGKAARLGNAEAKQLVETLRRAQNTQMVHIDGAE